MSSIVFDAVIQPVEGRDAAYVIVPVDIRKAFGRGRLKVRALFDGAAYDGSVVNMGVKDEASNVCYIIGIRKDIRARIGKQPGHSVRVELTPLL